MSLTTFLQDHIEAEKASFHMPGHKGGAILRDLGYGKVLDDPSKIDITEIPGADDLRDPKDVISEIERGYQELYGSRRSFISVNGSSALLMAAILAAVRPGRKAIVQRNSHISVMNGIELAGGIPLIVDPERIDLMDGMSYRAPGESEWLEEADGLLSQDERMGLTSSVDPGVIAEALDNDPDVDLVVITTPNYYGIVSDVERIAGEVHKRGKILLVDQAHGAHLKFYDSTMAAEDLGADIVIDSTHKTLCSFTQTAVGNIMTERVDAEIFRKKLLTLESTSPSYVLMASLGINLEIMKKDASRLMGSWRKDIEWFYKEAEGIEGLELPLSAPELFGKVDLTKITADFSGCGITGEEAEKKLIEEGIYPEFSYGNIVLLLTGVGNKMEDYELLVKALKKICGARG